MSDDQIMMDPGISFGVDTIESLMLIRSIPAFGKRGFPVLIGPSEKKYPSERFDKLVDGRMIGTVSACLTAADPGRLFVRVLMAPRFSERLRCGAPLFKQKGPGRFMNNKNDYPDQILLSGLTTDLRAFSVPLKAGRTEVLGCGL